MPIWRLDSVGVSQSGPAFQGINAIDTAYYNDVVAAMNALAAAPGDNHVIAMPQVSTVVLQQVPTGQGGSVTGLIQNAVCGFGTPGTGVPGRPCVFYMGRPGDFTMGPMGNGVLNGKYSPYPPTHQFYQGTLNTITALMTDGFLRGTINIASYAAGSGPVFTIGFRAVQVAP